MKITRERGIDQIAAEALQWRGDATERLAESGIEDPGRLLRAVVGDDLEIRYQTWHPDDSSEYHELQRAEEQAWDWCDVRMVALGNAIERAHQAFQREQAEDEPATIDRIRAAELFPLLIAFDKLLREARRAIRDRGTFYRGQRRQRRQVTSSGGRRRAEAHWDSPYFRACGQLAEELRAQGVSDRFLPGKVAYRVEQHRDGRQVEAALEGVEIPDYAEGEKSDGRRRAIKTYLQRAGILPRNPR